MKQVFVKRDGKRIIMPDGMELVSDSEPVAKALFSIVDTYGCWCLTIGATSSVVGLAIGIVSVYAWDKLVKPKIRKKKSKRTGA